MTGTLSAPTRSPAPGRAPDGTVGAPVIPAAAAAGREVFAELTVAARAAVTDAAAAAGWSAGERARALAQLDRVGDLLTAARGRVLTAERDAGTWAGRGDRDLAGWRGRTARTGVGEAAAQVREAETLQAMPRVEQALTSGTVRSGHVGVLAKAAAKVPEHVGALMRTAAGQVELLALAYRRDTREYARAVDRWVARHDPATIQRTHDNQRERRFLHVSHTPGGTHVKGLLDSLAGHTLQLALEAASPRPAADEARTTEQRRTDALTTLAERLLADRDTTPGAKVRPHISLILREETWASLRAHGDSDQGGNGRAHGGIRGLLTGLQDAPAPTTEDGAPVPASEVARLLCDCEITRIVVGTDSVPVDLGRTARLHSPAQRRAITHRDGGCAWTGCQIPARWCEIHHPRWWTRDHGETSLENGVLLCGFHHHEVHRRDLTIARTTTVPVAATARATAAYTVTRPDGRILAGPDPGAPPGLTDGQSSDRPRQIEPGSSAYSP